MVLNSRDDQRQSISFPGKDPTEEFQFYFLRHPIRLWRSIAIMVFWLLIFAALVYVSGVYSMEDLWMARVTTTTLCVFLIVPQINFLMRVYAYYLRVVIVTDKKIHIFKRTLLTTDRHEIVDLALLQDMNKIQRSIVQTIFGFGSLKLDVPTSQIRIHFTPHVNGTYERIAALRDLAKQRLNLPPSITPAESLTPQPT
jgi:hypothetical protein